MSLEVPISVCFGRSRRFAASIEGRAAIWQLAVSVEGVPHPLSGMVVNLVTMDSWLEEAEKELVSSGEWRRAVTLVEEKLSSSPLVIRRCELSLDDGIERRITKIIS